MKKFLYLLLALPMFASMAACDDDDNNIPDVSVSIEYSGGTLNDGVLTVVQGDTLKIEGLKVTPAPNTGKAMLGQTTYFFDGRPFFTTAIAPFGVDIVTDDLAVGNHTLSVNSQIFQEGKSIGWGVFSYKLDIVEAPEDQPGDTGGGTDTPEQTITESVNN
ncbi:hypothetical protein [uncultured Duncaniella sp.]|jgi:hypothetical protein|uniref:hypothetical protein n=1 Tax=uncultured Duncaniella sp. TaxID=2768039 RepID=UPI002674F1C0|nr:hypothetical protein [uncultured Duncaniella sp.]MCI9172100.1 hypothetical protein [Muribaculaceae bacterium]